MKMPVIFAGLLACLILSTTASAQVYRSDSGLGSALILPYWTVANGNDTVFSVRNESEQAVAVKVRLLDEQGGLVESFNLYLDAYSIWAAGIGWVDDQILLAPLEAGCMLPAPSASHMGRPVLPLAAPRGSIEIIEMASASEESDLVVEHIFAGWADCAELAEAFESGVWSVDLNAGLVAPTHQLSASASLINVAAGGINTVPATALGGFSDIAQHSAPESALPDLAQAFDAGAEQGGVRSLVCASGECRVDEWTLPIEAVAAALMVSTQSMEYSVEPSLAAEFEWIIHRPLKRYEDEVDGFAVGDSSMLFGVWARSGEYFLPVPCFGDFGGVPPLLGPECRMPPALVLQSLPFNSVYESLDLVVDSSILGHPAVIRHNFALGGDDVDVQFLEGTARLYFGDPNQWLTAADGTGFLGQPVISFGVQQYSNGFLTDDQGQNVLSNYRRTERPRHILLILPVDGWD